MSTSTTTPLPRNGFISIDEYVQFMVMSAKKSTIASRSELLAAFRDMTTNEGKDYVLPAELHSNLPAVVSQLKLYFCCMLDLVIIVVVLPRLLLFCGVIYFYFQVARYCIKEMDKKVGDGIPRDALDYVKFTNSIFKK